MKLEDVKMGQMVKVIVDPTTTTIPNTNIKYINRYNHKLGDIIIVDGVCKNTHIRVGYESQSFGTCPAIFVQENEKNGMTHSFIPIDWVEPYVPQVDEHFYRVKGEWSQKTFGDSKSRPATSPLKHLQEEAKEVLEHPNDLSEYADCLMCLLDGAYRAGFTYEQLAQACWDKLKICQESQWYQTDAGYYKRVK